MEMVKQQEVTKVPDVLGYLRTKYLEVYPGAAADSVSGVKGDASLDSVDYFIEVCRTAMRDNQAVGVDYLSLGMGIRLQDGTVLSWVDVPEVPSPMLPGVGSGMAISQPSAASKKGIVPTQDFPVTGAKKAT